jgi:adenylate cyclase class 2
LIEQEVKLAFDSPEAARLAVTTAGGRLVISRRLIADQLLDTADRALGRAGTACRLRREGGRAFLTFKGPVQPAVVKTREEIETGVANADDVERILGLLGYREVFRSEKYREEYDIAGANVTVDETPIGVFVEIEAEPDVIAQVTALLHRTQADYRLESYPKLYFAWCAERGLTPGDMTFS